MKKWKVMDSLGETIGHISSTGNEEAVQAIANKLYAADNPTVKLITTTSSIN